MTLWKSLLACALGATVASAGAQAPASAYPVRPITLVLGFAPGGPADFAARLVGDGLSKRLGQPVVVDNKPGAVGTIAAGQVARAAPDGYTLLVVAQSTLAIAPHTLATVPFDAARSFAPISSTIKSPWILMVHPSLNISTLPELVAYAKKNPGQLNYGSIGRGGSHNFVSELFKMETGTDIAHIPFKGSADAHVALVRGDIHMMFDTMPTPITLLEGGKVKGIGSTGATRLAVLPGVATFAEQKLPQMDVSSWFGLVAPAGTPPAVIAKLNAAAVATLTDPAVKDTLRKSGLDAVASTPEEFGAFIAQEYRRWQKTVEATNFKKE